MIFGVNGELVSAEHSWRSVGAFGVSTIEPCVGVFALWQLCALADAAPQSGSGLVELQLGDSDVPLLAEYRPFRHVAKLQLYLAPRSPV